VQVATENMVQAIESITIEQGIDPTVAVLIGGGGAAGLNASIVGRRLGCDTVIIPQLGGVLSAVGMLLSDLVAEYAATFVANSDEFDLSGVNSTLAALEKRAQAFVDRAGQESVSSAMMFSADARYPDQIWELPVTLKKSRFENDDDVEALRQGFHNIHQEVFAVHDPGSAIEIVGWRVRAECRLRAKELTMSVEEVAAPRHGAREVWFPETGLVTTPVVEFSALTEEEPRLGPLLVESPLTTVVVEPGTTAVRSRLGNLILSRDGSRPT
jgi:N-methylhydantoinase A